MLNRKYLVHPNLDLWLVAGVSIFFWALFLANYFVKPWLPALDHALTSIGVMVASASIFINFPHFMMSYKLAYERGWEFIITRWFELLLVPLILLLGFTSAYFYSMNTESFLRAAITLMIISVGWHYAKQFYGCVLVAAHYENYPLNQKQRSWLKYNFLSVWWLALVNRSSTTDFHGLQYFNLPSIPILVWLVKAVIFITTLGVMIKVFAKNRANGNAVPRKILIPWLAYFLWMLPLVYSKDYFYIFVPFFHSLQYLVFTYRIENKRLTTDHWKKLSLVYASVIVTGYLAFEGIPNALTSHFSPVHPAFFIVAFAVFINVHHYFLDSVIWRFDNEHIRRYLLQ